MLSFNTALRNMIGGQRTNLVTNGTFTSGTSGWTGSASATLTNPSANLRVAAAASNQYAYQSITTVVGKLYRLRAYIKSDGTATASLWAGATVTDNKRASIAEASIATSTVQEFYFIATATSTIIGLVCETNGQYVEFDTVTCVQMPQAIQDVFEGCFISIFSGTLPTDTNAAISATKLVTFFSDGASAGLSFGDTVSGVLSGQAGQNWTGTAVATGTAGFFVVYLSTDNLGSTTTQPRIFGTIATSGGDAAISPIAAITSGAPYVWSSFNYTLPGA